jgi:uncharacterized protein
MDLKPLPRQSTIRWRRLDLSGHEEARIEQTSEGWRLTGQLQVTGPRLQAQLVYVIECERDWRTRHAAVRGSLSSSPLGLEITSDGQGHWSLAGAPLHLIEGALDIDFGFTPATNLLPIRRLDLAVGQRAQVRTAWLRFPELRVEALEQSYRREAPTIFRYEAMVDGELFRARLDTDEFGRIVVYQGLWEMETGWI